MIITPPGFEIAIDLVLDDDAIAHVFVRDSLVQFSDSPGALPWRFYREMGLVPERVHSLGVHEGRRHVAVGLAEPPGEGGRIRIDLPHGLAAQNLRSWYGVVDDATLAIGMRAVQVLEWDRTHRFCGACGTPTHQDPNERAKRCPSCGLTVYPRITPAMMVLVTRGRELLLGRGINFPPGRYSALAGFMEAGETVEDTIHREVFEETNVQVKDLRYFGSQSWPFPNSLMLAYFAEYAGGDMRANPTELADAQWFTPEDLPQLPPRMSISRALIEARLAELRAG